MISRFCEVDYVLPLRMSYIIPETWARRKFMFSIDDAMTTNKFDVGRIIKKDMNFE